MCSTNATCIQTDTHLDLVESPTQIGLPLVFKVLADMQLEWLCRLTEKSQNDAFTCNHEQAREFSAADSRHYLHKQCKGC